MRNLEYNELKMKDYLTDVNTKIEQKKIVFQYRTKMAKYGENYRGGQEFIMCPLCDKHTDSQDMSFKCSSIEYDLKIKGNIQEIYKDNITIDMINKITKISKYRKDRLEK